MKTVKNIVTRGLLVMALALMAMAGVGSGTKTAQAKQVASKDGSVMKIKIPKNAKKAERKAVQKLNKTGTFATSYTWEKGRLVQLQAFGSEILNEKKRITPAMIDNLSSLEDLSLLSVPKKGWKTADFSKLKNLKKLHIYDGRDYIRKVNLSKNRKLADLALTLGSPKTKSKLSKLDLSQNTNLRRLEVSSDSIKKIDLSKNKKLEDLSIGTVSKLDLSKNKKIEKLHVYSSNIKKLDLSKNTRLKELWLQRGHITKIDLLKLKKLQSVRMEWSGITSFSVKGLPSLEEINLYECDKLKKVSLTDCSKLKLVGLGGKQLAEVNIKNCPKVPPVEELDYNLPSDGERPVFTYDNKVYRWTLVEEDGESFRRWQLQK